MKLPFGLTCCILGINIGVLKAKSPGPRVYLLNALFVADCCSSKFAKIPVSPFSVLEETIEEVVPNCSEDARTLWGIITTCDLNICWLETASN